MEFRHFLDNVVGVSLYGVMPDSVERFHAHKIRKQRGYTADWPKIEALTTSWAAAESSN
jgi:hypothetical protein